ncbi:MAG: NAD(P)-binding protein, partial [Oligoflexia bacterium]|nr:NAD(P)-binding protein [Oligoflexia bacterium]
MSKSNLKKVVVVLGAGCTGLATACKLQGENYQVYIIEKNGQVGGLSGGVYFQNNLYEYGPHIFHTTDSEVLKEIKDISGTQLLSFKKTIKVEFQGELFSFPLTLKDILSKLPLYTILKAGLSFLYHRICSFLQKEIYNSNAEWVLKKNYGSVLYQLFFKDYIYKVWSLEPKDLDPSFAEQRVPKLSITSLGDRLIHLVKRKKNHQITTQNFIEKTEGENFITVKGFIQICKLMQEKFLQNNGVLYLNSNLKKISITDQNCSSVLFTHDGKDVC